MVTAERTSSKTAEAAGVSGYQFVELTLRLPAEWELSWETICQLSLLNEVFQFQRTAEGALIVTGPPPMESGWIETGLAQSFSAWADENGWRAFPSSTGYALSDGSVLIPDVSLVRMDQLPRKGDHAAWRGKNEIMPPFIVEVRSPGQQLSRLQIKMERWMANGVRLGWLIDPIHRRIHVYRPEREAEVLDDPKSLSGEDVMEGLVVDLSDVWP